MKKDSKKLEGIVNDASDRPTIRTITAFVELALSDFEGGSDYQLASFPKLEAKLTPIIRNIKVLEKAYQEAGYEVQTLRLATNPFGEWLLERTNQNDCLVVQKRLRVLDHLLSRHSIFACGLGPAKNRCELACCRQIIGTSDKFSCSYMIPNSNHVEYAEAAAQAIYDISTLHPKGLSNFQFCVGSNSCPKWIPFFPIAYHESSNPAPGTKSDVHDDEPAPLVVPFAIGLENGPFVKRLLQDCQSISNIDTMFRHGYTQALLPIQDIAESFATCTSTKKEHPQSPMEQIDSKFRDMLLGSMFSSMDLHVAADLESSVNNGSVGSSVTSNTDAPNKNNTFKFEFVGIDTSVNPSLDEHDGSVAAALECLAEVPRFGGPGTMAAAAAITRVLQSLESIRRTGYCGLMLPVCEDRRLTDLASSSPPLSVVHLLNISSVCGVGVDAVPVPGHTIDGHDKQLGSLRSLILDVLGLAERWNKPLTVRVLPVPGMQQGEETDFEDSPHMVDSVIFPLEY